MLPRRVRCRSSHHSLTARTDRKRDRHGFRAGSRVSRCAGMRRSSGRRAGPPTRKPSPRSGRSITSHALGPGSALNLFQAGPIGTSQNGKPVRRCWSNSGITSSRKVTLTVAPVLGPSSTQKSAAIDAVLRIIPCVWSTDRDQPAWCWSARTASCGGPTRSSRAARPISPRLLRLQGVARHR